MPQSQTQEACNLLDADHVAVKHLFVAYARLAVETPDAVSERTALAQKICDELTVHATIEEEIFYPAVGKAVGAADLLEHAKAEHQQAKDLIGQIEGLTEAGPEMDDLVVRLTQVIEHHVKEERDYLFPKARAAAGLDLFELGNQLKQRQQELEAEMA